MTTPAPHAAPPHPNRGDHGAYARYLAGMDASMAQKVALVAAHLLARGRVADLGMGSGTGSHALAQLYPTLDVVGVDLDPEMVRLASERYRLPNLSFLVGDIAAPTFAPASLEAAIASSVLHHVTTFSGYDDAAARRALEVQAHHLRPHGLLIVRDFLDPGPGLVWLDVRADDGDDGDDPATCSTAALLERFAREFRPLVTPPQTPGFPLRPVEATPTCPLAPGFRRYELSHKHAAELVLRKDYRRSWAKEVLEEYTYFTQPQFEAAFSELGLRVLASTPLRNPWIVRHRLLGHVALWSTAGEPLELPATNYVIVGERVPEGEGVRFVEARTRAPLGYLERTHWRHLDTGHVRDLVRRPNMTLDVLPWFAHEGDLYVLTRRSYPRPVLSAGARGGRTLDDSLPPHYVTEPLTLAQGDKPVGQSVEEALAELAGVSSRQLVRFEPGGRYYPSPGGIQEEVQSTLVEIAPTFVRRPHPARSSFSTSGQVRAIEARQLLRAAQVGGLPDARLELNVYDLLQRQGLERGPWIGDELTLSDGPAPPAVATAATFAARPPRRRFERVGADESARFLQIHCAEFEELDHNGEIVASQPLEYVVPGPLGLDTVALAVLCRAGGEVYLATDDDDLPAAQCFTGNSHILVAPAWRLPRDLRTLTPAHTFALARLRGEYGVEPLADWALGGPYYPSPGLTPEVVHPLAVAVVPRPTPDAPRALTWVRLAELVAGIGQVRDGHLRITALRAAHALGV